MPNFRYQITNPHAKMKTINISDNLTVMEIAQRILNAHKIVVITGMSPGHNVLVLLLESYPGAGISVSAGLPAFRGKEGLYSARGLLSCSGHQGNMEELFHVSVLKVFMHLVLIMTSKLINYNGIVLSGPIQESNSLKTNRRTWKAVNPCSPYRISLHAAGSQQKKDTSSVVLSKH